jgi:hypothetical protein
MTVRFASSNVAVRLVIAVGLHLAAVGTMVRLVSTHAVVTHWLTAQKFQCEGIRMQDLSFGLNQFTIIGFS